MVSILDTAHPNVAETNAPTSWGMGSFFPTNESVSVSEDSELGEGMVGGRTCKRILHVQFCKRQAWYLEYERVVQLNPMVSDDIEEPNPYDNNLQGHRQDESPLNKTISLLHQEKQLDISTLSMHVIKGLYHSTLSKHFIKTFYQSV